jgi:hypothetical protein
MGLGAQWREGLLAQAVIAGETRGWRKHPQLNRLKEHPDPDVAVEFYLLKVWEEAASRGYRYDLSKIRRRPDTVTTIPITTGQLAYEFELLLDRTRVRTPKWHERIRVLKGDPAPHPIFHVVEGGIADWEVAYWRGGSASKGSTASHHSATPSRRGSS